MFILSDSSHGNTKPIYFKDKESKNLRTLLPRKKVTRSIGSFHPKIMILRFEEKLRVVIGSGNLASGDWYFWSNVFVKFDFPKKTGKKRKLSAKAKRKRKKLKIRKKNGNTKRSKLWNLEEEDDNTTTEAATNSDSMSWKSSIKQKNSLTSYSDFYTKRKNIKSLDCSDEQELSESFFRLNRKQKTALVNWSERIEEHKEHLSDLGYDFERYLKTFLDFCMKDYTDEMEDYLGIDFKDYDIEENDVLLVGSLPGGYDNVVNYSSEAHLKKENKIKSKKKKSTNNSSKGKANHFNVKKAVVERHSQRFSNLIVFEPEEEVKSQQVEKMKTSSRNSSWKTKKKIEALSINEVLSLRQKDVSVKKQYKSNYSNGNTDKNGSSSISINPGTLKTLKVSKKQLEWSDTSNTGFGLHGFSLVRFLLHCYPTSKPFDLNHTKICYVSSSLSIIDVRLMFDIAYSFIPGFPFEWRHLSEDLKKIIKNMFSVVFPSEEHVQQSILGPQNANCIFLDTERFKSRKFRKKILAHFESNDTISNSQKIIPHLKACIVSNADGKITDDSVIYIGSHNMTKAAWGRFSSSGEKLYVSNYEMGVVLPPAPGSMAKKKDIISKMGFVYPPRKYAPKEKPFTRTFNRF